MTKAMKLFAIATLLLSALYGGDDNQSSANQRVYDYSIPFTPGKLGYDGPSLAAFAPKRLLPACQALDRRDYKTAKFLFATENREDPTDLIAWVGTIQSSQDAWNDLLAAYEAQDEQTPSPMNDFKLGVVAHYMLHSDKYYGAMDWNKKMAFSKKKDFLKLYDSDAMLHSPIIAFIGNSESALESCVMLYGGENDFEAYHLAKSSHWSAPVPEQSPQNIQSLQILRWAIIGLRSKYFGKITFFPTPQNGVTRDLRPDQPAAQAWFLHFEQNVANQIIAEGGTPEYVRPGVLSPG